MSKCKIATCDRAINYPAYGWCHGHYSRFIKKGDPGDTPIRKQKKHLEKYLILSSVSKKPHRFLHRSHKVTERDECSQG